MTEQENVVRGQPTESRPTGLLGTRRTVPGTDLEVARLCLGGNVFGFTCDESEAFAVLDAYWEAGGNMIDTADSYCSFLGTDGGESETIIGRWMADRRNRDDLVIATKVGQAPGRTDLRRTTIRRALAGSLRRLGVEQIDLYFAHQDHGDPLDEMVAAFDELMREGSVRYVAASNFAADRLEESLDLAAVGGRAGFVAVQPEYHLMNRAGFESDLAGLCDRRRLGVFPYWALACGYLTGKYRLHGPAVASPRHAHVEPFVTEQGERILDLLDMIGTRHQVGIAAIALAWLSARPGVIAPIASARSPEQLGQLLTFTGVELSPAELRAIDDLAPVGSPV